MAVSNSSVGGVLITMLFSISAGDIYRRLHINRKLTKHTTANLHLPSTYTQFLTSPRSTSSAIEMPASTLKPPAWVKAQSTYTVPCDTPPGPRHGHWSDRGGVTPEYVAIEAAAEQMHLHAWGYGRDGTVAEFKKANENLPLAEPLSSYAPRFGEEVVSHTVKAAARDGAEVEMRVYRRPEDAGCPATLAFKMHGGGWVVGDSNVEELENRILGALPGVVVVSVHYRLYVTAGLLGEVRY